MIDCVQWTGAVAGKGYGYINRGGRVQRVHRFIWAAHHGAIPKGMLVCHRCDNRLCINIEHLFLGTPLDNMRDMIAKGRAKHPSMKGIPQRRRKV